MKPIVIESHDEQGVEWGVSLDGPNPEAFHFLKTSGEDAAYALADKLGGLRCPSCESNKLIAPVPAHPYITCDPCGNDFPLVAAHAD